MFCFFKRSALNRKESRGESGANLLRVTSRAALNEVPSSTEYTSTYANRVHLDEITPFHLISRDPSSSSSTTYVVPIAIYTALQHSDFFALRRFDASTPRHAIASILDQRLPLKNPQRYHPSLSLRDDSSPQAIVAASLTRLTSIAHFICYEIRRNALCLFV